MLGLVGESGAGKSMVGRTIAQLLPPGFAVDRRQPRRSPAATSSRMDARDAPRAARPRDRVHPAGAALGAQSGADHRRSSSTSISRASALRRASGATACSPRSTRCICRTAPNCCARYPHQLSGGMCQRVLIAMAFASQPKLVIADEPTTALDVTIQARIVRLIAEMQERDGTAVMFITHDLRLAAQVCDEILVLYAGRAAEYGPARERVRRARPSLYALPAAREPGDERHAARALCAARAHAGPARLQRH